uniref:Zona pellucida sperm-binding protein 3 n=1 Tax=Nothobranchius korthausae TaxID=1143690 RepID=A0A1A8FQF2_9TELE
MTDDSFIYTFTVNYNPTPLGSAPVVRTNNAAVVVECHYPRKQNVSSLPLTPHWVPFSAVKMAEEFLYFTLKLMTDDWMYERPSHQYFLGDMIHIEAAVKEYFHVPLRVYVDECVATLSPDANSSPSYAFIDNHGCFMDARITGSDSRFLPRTTEDKLHFQLEAFRFQGATSDVIYITCHLVATSAAYVIDTEHRACSYSNGWTEVSGADVCASCESGTFVPYVAPVLTPGTATGGAPPPPPALPPPVMPPPPPPAYPQYPSKYPVKRPSREAPKIEGIEWEGFVTLGPIPVKEKVKA